MSQIAQRRDISDPDEIQRFAAQIVATQERLDYLYTLTVADIHWYQPGTMECVAQLRCYARLYTETRRALSRGLENPVDRDRASVKIRHAAAAADVAGIPRVYLER